MIIQTRALSGGVVLPNCPYGGCGGVCPSCVRTLALRQYAPSLRGFGGFGSYNAFGAMSFTTPERACDVSVFDGQPNGWQDFCDCMFAPEDPNRLKCRKRPCLNPLDSDPDCVFAPGNIPLTFAPWTEIGAGVRGIPKRECGILCAIAGGFAPVEPYELEPDYLFMLMLTNPIRAVTILGRTNEAFFKARQAGFQYAIPEPVLMGMYALLGGPIREIVQNIPGIGAGITLSQAALVFATGGVATWPIVLPVAIPYALTKGGDRFEQFILDPIWNFAGDATALISSALTTLSGNPEGLARLISVLCRRAAKLLPQTGAQDIEVARALLNAASKSAPLIVKIIKDPQTAFTSVGTYAQIGGTLKEIATSVAGFGNQPLADTLLVIGDVFQKLDPSMTAAALAIATRDTNQYLCCGPDTAYDLLPVNYLGFKISAIVEIAENLKAAGLATSAELNKAVFGAQKAQLALMALQDGLNAIALFAQELDKALAAIGAAGQFFTKVVEKLLAEKAKLDEIVNAAQNPNSAGSISATPAARQMQKMITLGQRGGFRFTLPKPSAGPSLLPVLLGAGAGFLVGGPPGALVGGGALLLASKPAGAGAGSVSVTAPARGILPVGVIPNVKIRFPT